ncbi:MAG: beta-lactamase family protein [Candidatus Zixiibacteriota bacterium]|nr:MAG: beta-lactamase family protein [candidate division Zixibacteria bacterium]
MYRTLLNSALFSLLLFATTAFAQEEPAVVMPSGEPTAEKITAYLDELIDSLVARDEFSGTVLVAKDGQPVYKRAVGEACRWYHVPNKIDTKFCLGSMNKMFTSVAIAQLVARGKLSYDDEVGKHLPDYPNEDVKSKVTIHHLLTHTSGMGMYWQELFTNPEWPYIATVAGYDSLANKNPLLFEPGEQFQYSNCGPLVVGLIIEKISGMTYDDYIREYVTGPAGMTNTDCYDIKDPVHNVAIGYTRMSFTGEELDHPIANLFLNPTKGGPAGGGYSTVEDLLKFDIALRSNELLSKEYFDLISTAKVDRDENRGYGYFFEEKFVGDERIIGHGGGAAGIHANLAMFMNSGWTVAMMSNYDFGLRGLRGKAEQLLTQK